MIKSNSDQDRPLRLSLWAGVGIVFVWSFIGCHDRFTWFLETVPVIIGTIVLLKMSPEFRFTRLVSILMAIHACILMIGGHYTYANVPLFNWIRDSFHLTRNYYDRLGHLAQGFVPALIAREVLIRKNVLRRGGWMSFIILCICLAISASYELFEWRVAVATGARADDFLGSQGDPWDTQWDMACALIGAMTAVLMMPRFHDAELSRADVD